MEGLFLASNRVTIVHYDEPAVTFLDGLFRGRETRALVDSTLGRRCKAGNTPRKGCVLIPTNTSPSITVV